MARLVLRFSRFSLISSFHNERKARALDEAIHPGCLICSHDWFPEKQPTNRSVWDLSSS